MKKYLSILAMMAVIFTASSVFVSCGGDDFEDDYQEKEIPTLIGTWEGDGTTWKITKDTFRIINPSDLANNITIPYVYKNNIIYLIYNDKEWAYAQVDKLTLDSLHVHLVPGAIEGVEHYPSYKFKRVSNNTNPKQDYDVSSDFLEVTINGQTYRKNLLGIYTGITMGNYDGVELYTTSLIEDAFSEEYNFKLFLGLCHYSDIYKTLDCPTGNYNVLTSEYEIANFCLDVLYQASGKNYMKIQSGTHKVTLIRRVGKNVQVCGEYSVVVKTNNNETAQLSGKYAMTLSK